MMRRSLVTTLLCVSQSISLLLLAATPATVRAASDSSSSSISELILVDAKTQTELLVLHNDTVVDTAVYGTALTIRAVLDDSGNSGGGDATAMVEWNLDAGKTRRVESTAPFLLAGKEAPPPSGDGGGPGRIEFYASNLLAQPGVHTVSCKAVASAALQDQRRRLQHTDGALTVRFAVVAADGPSETPDTFLTGDSVAVVDEPGTAIDQEPASVPASAHGTVSLDASTGTVTIGFLGPIASETGSTEPGTYRAPSTFADYRLDLEIRRGGGGGGATAAHAAATVPCYYAGSGNAARDRSVSGSVWLCHYRPAAATLDGETTFAYAATFRQGTNAAVAEGGDPAGFMDGATGTFDLPSSSPSSNAWTPPRYKWGLATNLFHYAGYDNTAASKWNYAAHAADYNRSDFRAAAWEGGGENLLGALRYLTDAGGFNAAVVDPLSGDGVVTPFVDNSSGDGNSYLSYDISKLAQWQIALDAALQLGWTVYLQTAGGGLSELFSIEQEQLFFRELMARFGHYPNLVWEDLSSDDAVVVVAADTTPAQILSYWMENDAVLLALDDDDESLSSSQDFRSHHTLWQSVRNVATLLDNLIPAGTALSVADLAVSGATECWSDADATIVVVHYYPDNSSADTTPLQLTLESTYSVQWYDVVRGGDLQDGSVTTVAASGASDLGAPPSSTGTSTSADWLVVLLACTDCSA